MKTRGRLEAEKNDASERFNKIQYESIDDLIKSVENLGKFAAASIASSITILGFIFNSSSYTQLLLSKDVLFDFLLIAWVNLLLSVVCSCLTRWVNGNYLHANAGVYLLHTDLQLSHDINKSPLVSGQIDDLIKQKEDFLNEGRWRERFYFFGRNLFVGLTSAGLISGLLFLVLFSVSFFLSLNMNFK